MLKGNTYIDPINLPPLPPGKSDIDVSADYLSKVRMAMKSHLEMSLGEVFSREERKIQYYFTIPVTWNDTGQKSLRAAIVQAGYLRDENDNRLSYVTESEAAAHYCLKISLLNLRVKDVILIVDCGTGTVDLQACELVGESPHSFAEFTAGSGDSCG
jgi:molecular chaperone DnaK (HSP70)